MILRFRRGRLRDWQSIRRSKPLLVRAGLCVTYPLRSTTVGSITMSMYRWMLSAALIAACAVAFAAPAGLDQTGKPDLKSAGALAFGPKGVLFVGDPQGAQVIAIDVGTAPTNPIGSGFKLEGADAKI